MKKEEALIQIEYMKEILNNTRLRAAEGYPYLIFWGIIWFCGYMGSLFTYNIWNYLSIIGFIGSGIIGTKWNWSKDSDSKLLKQLGLQSIILFIVFITIFILFLNAEFYWLINAFWPFSLGIIYILIGIFMGRDLIFLGGGIVLTSIISLFIPGLYQHIWLAFTGGGGLIITGFIFRNQVKQSG